MDKRLVNCPRRLRRLKLHSRTRLHRLKMDPAAFALVGRIAESRDVSLVELLQGGQSRGYLGETRQIAMYLVHVLLQRTQKDVGLLFTRSHASVSYACQRVELARDDPKFDAEIEAIERAGAELRDAA